MRLNKPIVAVSTAALLALASCGGSGGGGGGAEQTFKEGGAAGSGQDPTRTQGPAPEIAGAQKGGVVKVISFAGLNSMDPSEAYYTNTYSILSNLVTRSLTQQVYDPETKDMILIPDLATDLGTPNDDYTEWKFTIRDGVKYENGQPVTADDIAYGIKRSFDRATFPDGAAYSNDYFLDGDTYGGPYKDGTDYKGVVVDGNTLTLKMARPFPELPYWGFFPAIGPIPEGKDSDPAKYALHPWATGPYKFDEYTPQKSLTLVKNDQWDPATDPGRHQYVDGFDMRFDVESAKIDQIMLQDEGDAQNTLSYDAVQAPDYLTFKQDSPDRLVFGSNPCHIFYYPDYRKITDVNVRRALAYAFPYKDIYAAYQYIEGVTVVPSTNILPPGVPGRVEYNPLPDHEPGSTDAAKAKQLLEQADAVGTEIKFLYQTDDVQDVDASKVLSKALETAGFKATPIATTTDNYYDDLDDTTNEVNFRYSGWCSDWSAGGSWFGPVFQTTNLDKEGFGYNYAAFSEPAVDKEILRIQTLPIEDQPDAYQALDELIMKKYFPAVPVYYGGEAEMRGTNVNGMNIDATVGMPTWRDMWLSQ